MASDSSIERVFNFTIEARNASDQLDFQERAKATIERAQNLLSVEKEKSALSSSSWFDSIFSRQSPVKEDVSVHSVFVRMYQLKAVENSEYIKDHSAIIWAG